jgi:hypothetical protein
MSKVRDWVRRATSPSASRWGISAFLLAASFFGAEASGMLDSFFAVHHNLQLALFWFSVLLFALAIVFSLFWLFGKKEPLDGRTVTHEDITRLVGRLDDLINEIRSDRDERKFGL